jgi:hypothetical protein
LALSYNQLIATREDTLVPETSEQYVNRMYTYIEGKDPRKLMDAAPARLAKLLKGVTPAKGRKRPAPGKWSISEIVAHIADTELVIGYRLRAVLGAPGIQLIGFDQDAWVTALHYDKRDLKKSFAQYCAFREANLALLKTLRPEQWKHEGLHNERGPQSIETIVKMTAGHDLNHFQQIERIRAAKK